MNTKAYVRGYIRTHCKYFVFLLLLPQILYGFVNFLYYPLLEKVVNSLAQQENVVFFVSCFVSVVVASLSLKFVFNQGKAHFFLDMKADLSKSLIGKMWKTPVYMQEKIPEGKFIEINKNAELIEGYIQSRVNIVIAFVLFVLSAVYIVISVHFMMLVIELALIIVMLLLNIVSRPLEERQQKILEKEEAGISIIRNICNSIDIIKQYFMEHVMINKMLKESSNIGDSKLRRSDLQNVMEVLNQIVGCIIMIVIPFLTALLNNISYGNIVISMLLFFFLMEQVTTIMSNLMTYNQSKVTITYMNEILAQEELKPPTPIDEKIRKLEIINITIGYGDDKFQKKISSNFEIGGINAVVGESGSGKSTLLKFMAGALKIEDDTVYINGQKRDVFSLQPHIAYVPQPFYVVSGDTLYNLDLSKKGITYKQIGAYYALMFGDSIQFWNNHNSVENFSGGQQQIIGILRGVICEKDVLLMDEPTSSMSDKMREKFIVSIQKYSQDHLVIIATHDPDIIEHASNVIRV